jgi:Single-strand binding protein family.
MAAKSSNNKPKENFMANDFQSICISGRLTADAELVKTQTGKTDLIRLKVAHNRAIKDKNGNFQDNPLYLDVIYFSNNIDRDMDRFKKGTYVLFPGSK